MINVKVLINNQEISIGDKVYLNKYTEYIGKLGRIKEIRVLKKSVNLVLKFRGIVGLVYIPSTAVRTYIKGKSNGS